MEVGDEVILKGFRKEKKIFNGDLAKVLKTLKNGALYVQCLGLRMEVKKHQYKKVE